MTLAVGPALLAAAFAIAPAPWRFKAIKQSALFCWILIFASCFSFIVLLAFGKGRGFEGSEGILRLSWPFYNPQEIYPFLALLCAICAWVIIIEPSKTGRWIAEIALGLAVLALGLTFSKAGQSGTIACLLVMLFPARRLGPRRWLVIAVSILILASMAGLRLRHDTGFSFSRKSALSRVENYAPALNAIKTSLLFGRGPGGVERAIQDDLPNEVITGTPKNLYLDTLGSLGLVGTILVVFLVQRIHQMCGQETLRLFWGWLAFVLVGGMGNGLFFEITFPFSSLSCWLGFAATVILSQLELQQRGRGINLRCSNGAESAQLHY